MATNDRILLLEPVGGIAGDMFLAAAIDLGLDLRTLEEILKTLRLPDFSLKTRRAESGGVSGTHLDVVVREEEAHHHHRGLAEILTTIEESGLSPAAKAGAKGVFSRLGRAEAKVHGVDLSDIRFHEVGAVDSLVDLCGAAVVLDLLGWPKIYSFPPELGVGVIKGAHGAMPVPPPAVLELLLGKPVQPGGPPGEAVTPTGAAILAEWADFGRPPTLSAEKVGYGVGTRTWPDRPNVLRMTLGKAASSPLRKEDLLVLEANLDDSTGEMVARAIEAALEKGALDAWASPLVMKKGRPGLLLGALVEIAKKEAVADAFFAETTTLGVRMYPVERMALEREMSSVETPYGTVRLKLARKDGRLMGIHPEYEDCLRRAKERGVSVREVMNSALAAHLRR